jgi:hypothetical protein
MASYTWPSEGAGGGVPIYSTLSAFPAASSVQSGSLAVAADTGVLYESNGISWQAIGSPGSALAVGAIDSQSAVANALQIVANTLYAQSASAINPGMVNTTTQSFAGQKTFTTGITGTLTGHATLDVATSSLGNFTDSSSNADGITVTGGTGATVGNVSIAQAAANASQNGYLKSTDWSTFNSKQAAGNYITALTGDVTASGPGPSAATLATVNASPGTYTNASVTVNAKGLVTSASSGTAPVTSVSVASSNGFAGSSSGGSTPALTLSTTITGVLKGNGTAISAATPGTDYSAGTSGLATGIIKSTTSTGALSVATAGTDYVVPSGNITGTAANITASSNTSLTSLANLATVGTVTTGVWNGTCTAGYAFLTSGTSWTSPAGITTNTQFKFTLIGAGGGGGGAKGLFASAQGGGSGACGILEITGISPSTAYTIAIGAAGSAGTNTPGNGGSGGNTSITIGGTTYTAGGGGGSTANSNTSSAGFGVGGGGGGTVTGFTINNNGTSGSPGIAIGSGNAIGGAGAPSCFGGGTPYAITAAGSGAGTYGAGGGGGSSNSSSTGQAGGGGGAGAMLIEWWN